MVKLTRDELAGASYLKLRDLSTDKQDVRAGGRLIIDVTADGTCVGIEILGFVSPDDLKEVGRQYHLDPWTIGLLGDVVTGPVLGHNVRTEGEHTELVTV